MSRERQIIDAGIEYTMQNNPICIGGDNFYETSKMHNRNSSFEAGAKWADEHPKLPWISVEEDLPCNHDELIHFGFTNNLLVIDDNKNTSTAFMKKYKNNEWIWDSTYNFVFLPLITHWMPVPKLPKE